MEPSIRKRFGSLSLALGCGSAAFVASFYAYVGIYHALPAHGLPLWGFFLVVAALSIAGIISGSFASGYRRQSALLISLVTFLECIRELAAGARARSLIDLVLLVVICAFGFAAVARRRDSRSQRVT